MNIQNYNPILKPHVEAFKKNGTLGDGAQKQDVPRTEIPEMKAQLTQQMDQVIFADNTEHDQNPEVGKVRQHDPYLGVEVHAEFEGNTSIGTIALDAQVAGVDSSVYAEFTESGALIIQSASNGGELGFVGVHLDYAGGESYVETLNLPDRVNLGL